MTIALGPRTYLLALHFFFHGEQDRSVKPRLPQVSVSVSTFELSENLLFSIRLGMVFVIFVRYHKWFFVNFEYPLENKLLITSLAVERTLYSHCDSILVDLFLYPQSFLIYASYRQWNEHLLITRLRGASERKGFSVWIKM